MRRRGKRRRIIIILIIIIIIIIIINIIIIIIIILIIITISTMSAVPEARGGGGVNAVLLLPRVSNRRASHRCPLLFHPDEPHVGIQLPGDPQLSAGSRTPPVPAHKTQKEKPSSSEKVARIVFAFLSPNKMT
ncbi:unnamed protein product [Pleuronectes platessa]|uniref:Uncharacterized protein n=1 Tax=Pleuronectes platessa TaxID=8262 RepID=A0A9N7VLG5_PLEPL|nr:unnamed protein product [Pleuronectes platessa]